MSPTPPGRRRCINCATLVEGWRRGNRCKPCMLKWQEENKQRNIVGRLANGVRLRDILPRHRGKR